MKSIFSDREFRTSSGSKEIPSWTHEFESLMLHGRISESELRTLKLTKVNDDERT